MDKARFEILKYNKQLFEKLFLWPDESTTFFHIKEMFHWITTLPLVAPIVVDIYMSIEEPNFEFQDITENFIEIATIVTAAYMLIAYRLQKVKILNVLEKLSSLQRFHDGQHEFLEKTEMQTHKLTQYFFHFVFWTNPVYAMIPLIAVPSCMEKRLQFQNATRAVDYFPCGLDFKSRFPFDVTSPVMYWLFEALEYYCSVVTTVCGVLLTTFMCSVLLYFIAEIQNLKRQISNICHRDVNTDLMYARLISTVEYHTNIIECSQMINEAFGLLLFMHFIITGFSISILAVNIMNQPLRYTAEILGWVLILFLPSTFGQRLLNESEDIANVAYNSEWYEAPIPIQKGVLLIIAASRRTLCLQSMQFGVFCHSTFVMVLKTAYSFFTLMVQK